MSTRRLSGGQIVTLVVSVCAAAVLAPVTVHAATGSFVNITDPAVSAYKAKVNAAGGLLVTNVDPTTKSQAKVDTGRLRVGDGSGNLTVDGAVSDADVNKVIYQSPAGGLSCGANAAGVNVATLNLSRYSKLRFAVKSGSGYQTIVQLRARAGSEVNMMPVLDWTVPSGQYGHTVFSDPPSSADLIVYFCNQAQIFVYGLR